MKQFPKVVIALFITIFLCIPFVMVILYYTHPMEDVSYNLFQFPQDGQDEWTGGDGWTFYTNEKGNITELVSDGAGGYLGISQPGQTFYYSRRLTEEADSPVLKIGTVNRTVSVFLDETLVYTDCPELDNRIGYLKLPMLEYDRTEPVSISLPLDYLGKTLTIALSSPVNSDTLENDGTVWPCTVTLYCGYSYESSLIASTAKAMIPAVLLLALALFLLAAFVWKAASGDFSLRLPVFALAILPQMCSVLSNTDFFSKYCKEPPFDLTILCFHLSVGMLLFFLTLYADRFFPLFLAITILQWICTLLSVVTQMDLLLPYGDWYVFFVNLPVSAGLFSMITVLAAAFILWKLGNRFFRHLAQTALILMGGYGLFLMFSLLFSPDFAASVFSRIASDITQLYPRFSSTLVWNLCLISSVISVMMELVEQETERRTEFQVLAVKNKLAMESYENLQRQSEDVHMFRHDAIKHYSLLRTMAVETPERVPGYIDELIGQVEQIRPIVNSKNQILNIILNGKLNSAAAKRISTEIVRSDAPEKLPLTDTELCCLVMNILDNAIDAAAASDTVEPYIKLDFHCKNNHFVFSCENSTAYKRDQNKKAPMPEHGYGLKIIHQIMNRWGSNMVYTEQAKTVYKITVVIPIRHQSLT